MYDIIIFYMAIKYLKYFLILFLLVISNLTINSQENNENSQNIIEHIEEESNGMISISVPQEIYDLMEPYNQSLGQSGHNRSSKTVGYRIQVFSDGQNQQTLESRANARGDLIVSRFPKYKGQVYTFSKAPNWYTRIGNFETITEANDALKELKKAFPRFAGEMRTVKCHIIIKK